MQGTNSSTAILLIFLCIITIIMSVYFIITYMNMKVNKKDIHEVNAKKYLEITGWTAICFSAVILIATFFLFMKNPSSAIVNVAFIFIILLFISMGVISLICASYIEQGVNKDKNTKEYTTCFWIGISSLGFVVLTAIFYGLYFYFKKKEEKKNKEAILNLIKQR